MFSKKTPLLCYWISLSLLLPASLFAQVSTPTTTSPTTTVPAPILFDSEGYPLLYKSTTSTTTTDPIDGQHITGDPPPGNPGDVAIDRVLDAQIGHTTVNYQGQVFNRPLSSCPKLLVDINMPFIQSCIASTAVVTYCNHGGADADQAYVEVQLDPELQLNSASVPFAAIAAQRYRLDIGTIAAGDCGNIDLHFTTACDPNLIGNTHCMDARIFPDTLCTAVRGSALLEVNGDCLGSQVQFRVNNHGKDLLAAHQMQYIIIEDHLIANGQRLVLQQGTLAINKDGEFKTTVPITTPTHMDYKMEVRDAQNTIVAIASVELCSSNPAIQSISSGFYVHKFWNGSPLPFTDQACSVNGQAITTANIHGGATTPLTTDNSGEEEDKATKGVVDDAHLTTPVQVRVAPNPVGAVANITLDGAEGVAYMFELYSSTGQLVRTLTLTDKSTSTLERQALPAGLYVYRVTAKGQALQEGKLLMK